MNEAKFKTREEYLLEACNLMKPLFEAKNAPLPEVRVSTGFPSVKALAAKSMRIGECWDKTASADGKSQIFISPMLDNVTGPQGVLSTLAHELVHAQVGCACGHKGPFKKLAKAIGLEGKMTSTNAGPDLTETIECIAEKLGPYPHAVLNPAKSGKKKQSTRMVKCECEECGFTVRTTRKWLDDVGAPHCPAHGAMKYELPDELQENDDSED
jgi:hypothetical protein